MKGDGNENARSSKVFLPMLNLFYIWVSSRIQLQTQVFPYLSIEIIIKLYENTLWDDLFIASIREVMFLLLCLINFMNS